MPDKVELSDKQKTQARVAGIWADRPGLGGEYPKMLYGAGSSQHEHLAKPLKIQGQYDVATRIVASRQEEDAALAEGWSLTPDLQATERAKTLEEENAALRAQLAERRGPGRPPKLMESANG